MPKGVGVNCGSPAISQIGLDFLLSILDLVVWVIASILHFVLHVSPESQLCKRGYPLVISFEWLSI